MPLLCCPHNGGSHFSPQWRTTSSDLKPEEIFSPLKFLLLGVWHSNKKIKQKRHIGPLFINSLRCSYMFSLECYILVALFIWQFLLYANLLEAMLRWETLLFNILCLSVSPSSIYFSLSFPLCPCLSSFPIFEIASCHVSLSDLKLTM